jgi:CHAT domain-containing protein
VALSACETGRSFSAWDSIHNYSGLDGAFLAKGARATLSTLWKIDDLAALLFMYRFYERLASQDTVANAYHSAINYVRTNGFEDAPPKDLLVDGTDQYRARDLSHPYYWAAFKLSGWTWGAR